MWPRLDAAAHAESRCRCGYRTAKKTRATMCCCGASSACSAALSVAVSATHCRRNSSDKNATNDESANRQRRANGRCNASWHAQTLGGAGLRRTPEAQSRCRCGRVPVPVQMWHGVSPVPVQMWLPIFSPNAPAGRQSLRCASAALWTLRKVANSQPVLQQSTTWREKALMMQRMLRAPSPSRWACAIRNCRSSLNATCG